MSKKDIVSMNFEELSSEFKEMGLPKFRATQVYDWLHKKCVASFEEMTNISKDLIGKLKSYAGIAIGVVVLIIVAVIVLIVLLVRENKKIKEDDEEDDETVE